MSDSPSSGKKTPSCDQSENAVGALDSRERGKRVRLPAIRGTSFRFGTLRNVRERR